MNLFGCRALGTILIFWVGWTPAVAQLQFDRLYPPVATVGSEVDVVAEGKFPAWPPRIVCDREDVTVAAAEESGKLRVSVSPEAPTGIAWVRMLDADSVSAAVPLLVERVESVTESEPNDLLTEASGGAVPGIRVGRLEKSGDVDTYRVSIRSGQRLVISVAANRVLASPMDAVLQLVDSRGNVLQQADDERGLDPQIVYDADADAELFVRVFAFPETPNSTIGFAGSKDFVYVLRLTTDGFLDHALPLVELPTAGEKLVGFGWNLSPKIECTRLPATDISPAVIFSSESMGWQWQTPVPLDSATHRLDSENQDSSSPSNTLPLVFSGHIDRIGEVDVVRFHVTKGRRFRAEVYSRRLGFLLDPVLRLVDPSDSAELAVNDDRERRAFDAAFEHVPKNDGVVELQVSDLIDGFGIGRAYSVVISEVVPSVELTLSTDRFVVKAGQSVEIPVSISRRNGFSEELRVSLKGLPDDLQVESAVSEPQGDSAKSVKLKLQAAKSSTFQGKFQVVAAVGDDQGAAEAKPYYAIYPLRDPLRLDEFWLTVDTEPKSE